MEKTVLRKRVESFIWRTAMMVLAVSIDFTAENIGLFNLPPETTILFGLILAELSKWLNTKTVVQS